MGHAKQYSGSNILTTIYIKMILLVLNRMIHGTEEWVFALSVMLYVKPI